MCAQHCKSCIEPFKVYDRANAIGCWYGGLAGAPGETRLRAAVSTAHSGLEHAEETLSAAAGRVDGVVEQVDAVVNSAAISTVADVASMMPGVADAAGQVVAGLLALADRFPLASQCGGVLKDLFALYQVGATQRRVSRWVLIAYAVAGAHYMPRW